MIEKPVDQILKEDIEFLIENKVCERKTLEYKEFVSIRKDSDKKEFLADVSSFANASGGDMVFGITEERNGTGEKTGAPKEAVGIENFNPDQDILKLESLIRSGIAQRIPGIQFAVVDGFDKGPVVVLRIGNSWAGPHMITYQHWSRFYSRTSNGKYPLDVQEIRSAFVQSELTEEKINNFRNDRIGKIIAGETPEPMTGKRKVILHLFPLESLGANSAIDLNPFVERIKNYDPIGADSYNRKFNFDGMLTYSTLEREKCYSYLQVFRNKVIEAVATDLLGEEDEEPRFQNKFSGTYLEKELISCLSRFFNLLREISVNPPILILLTLTGVKGLTIYNNNPSFFRQSPIDRDILVLPDITVENIEIEAEKTLQPLFDMIWQACGWEKSINYDQNGKWFSRS